MKNLTKEARKRVWEKAEAQLFAQAQEVIDDPKMGQWVKNIIGAEVDRIQEMKDKERLMISIGSVDVQKSLKWLLESGQTVIDYPNCPEWVKGLVGCHMKNEKNFVEAVDFI